MSDKRVLTIDRSKWRRGGDTSELREQFGFTYMRHSKNGMMCCLGFDALACGLTVAEITGMADPTDVDADGEIHREYLDSRVKATVDGEGLEPSDAAQLAINHNDDADLSDLERERLIREDLIALGWDDVVFVDGAAQS